MNNSLYLYSIESFENINLYQKSTLCVRKKTKLNYLSSHVLRSVYLIKLSSIHHTTEKRIFSRSSKIPRAYNTHELVIHRGNRFTVRYTNP
jgi:hypothetical protein